MSVLDKVRQIDAANAPASQVVDGDKVQRHAAAKVDDFLARLPELVTQARQAMQATILVAELSPNEVMNVGLGAPLFAPHEGTLAAAIIDDLKGRDDKLNLKIYELRRDGTSVYELRMFLPV